MLLTKNIIIKWSKKNKKWFEEKGYAYTKIGDEFEIKVEDLKDGSGEFINVQCDGLCEELKNIAWHHYKKCVKEDGKYYCHECAMKLYGGEKGRLTKLLNGKSFKQWCIENNRQDALDRWDYELNDCKPSEINYSTKKKYYFKCPKRIHKSELKSIGNFTKGQEGSISCNGCNSFAQWGIDNLGEDFLEKYWDYEKNILDPWKIDYGSDIKVWIKCQEKDYHGSYDVSPCNFHNNRRCPYCNNNHIIHILDSLGTLYPEVFNLWSNKNKTSPYEYSPHSGKKVYWKCPNGIHKDYKRCIDNSTTFCFRCPECEYYKGENIISEYLMKININYIPQKQFAGLIGLGGGLLSYDFYIPQYNLLIEFQGEQHGRFVKGWHKTIKGFEKQVEHDKRKKEYALENKYNFLEILYKDFDNIEEILSKTITEIVIIQK